MDDMREADIFNIKCAMLSEAINFSTVKIHHIRIYPDNLRSDHDDEAYPRSCTFSSFSSRLSIFFIRIFVRHPCHPFDRSVTERNRLSINTRAAPFFDKLRRDF